MYPSQEVFVYYNLHKHLWSVKCWKTKKVIQHTDHIVLSDVRYKVSEAGRQRVLREKRKNVHAGLRGFVFDERTYSEPGRAIRITYDPYKYDSFVEVGTKKPVHQDALVVMFCGKVYAYR